MKAIGYSYNRLFQTRQSAVTGIILMGSLVNRHFDYFDKQLNARRRNEDARKGETSGGESDSQEDIDGGL